jgi:hypothetical protein
MRYAWEFRSRKNNSRIAIMPMRGRFFSALEFAQTFSNVRFCAHKAARDAARHRTPLRRNYLLVQKL